MKRMALLSLLFLSVLMPAQMIVDKAADAYVFKFSGDGSSLIDYGTGKYLLTSSGEDIKRYETNELLYYLRD